MKTEETSTENTEDTESTEKKRILFSSSVFSVSSASSVIVFLQPLERYQILQRLALADDLVA